MEALVSDPNPSKMSSASDEKALESDLQDCRDFDVLKEIEQRMWFVQNKPNTFNIQRLVFSADITHS